MPWRISALIQTKVSTGHVIAKGKVRRSCRAANITSAAVFSGTLLSPIAALQPKSKIRGPGDKLHPNRAGYLAMAR